MERMVVCVVMLEQLVMEIALIVEIVRDVLNLLEVEVDLVHVRARDGAHGQFIPWPVPRDRPGASDKGISAGDRIGPGEVDVVCGGHENGVLLQRAV